MLIATSVATFRQPSTLAHQREALCVESWAPVSWPVVGPCIAEWGWVARQRVISWFDDRPRLPMMTDEDTWIGLQRRNVQTC